MSDAGTATSARDVARRIYGVVAARALNTFGRVAMGVTVQWEIYDRTHSKLALAGVGFAQVVPVIALFVPVGTLVDRSDRRKVATFATSLTCAVAIGLALLSWAGAPTSAYLALLLAQGCANAIHGPSSSSLIPLIIPRAELPRTNRASASIQELAGLVIPASS